jgi:hypothetical protein
MAAAEYLRENPDLFARLANAYLGLGGQPLPAGSIENQYARVIPGFDPVAAALFEIKVVAFQRFRLCEEDRSWVLT